MSSTLLNDSFTLPCGVEIPNRIVKSAMSENMADKGGRPGQWLFNLYERWGKSGAGILISGNVMIDRRALGEPRNVIGTREECIPELRKWADLAQQHGCHLWMQINHPGRQVMKFNKTSVSASDVPLKIPGMVRTPRPLEEEEIRDLIDRFGTAARIAKEAGWKGVQIHGAHGYLISQFLSPYTNKRTDQWGGSLENRARFPVEIYRDMRKKCGPDYPIGIKINSADFQRGGFSEEESLQVIDLLSAEGIDLIEVSGGTYERAAMTGQMKKQSTREREAYFMEFIVKARQRTKTPLLLTGGFRSKKVMEKALADGELDFVGMARPFAVYPNIARDLIEGRMEKADIKHIKTGVKFIDKLGFIDLTWYAAQIHRMGKGLDPDPNQSPWVGLRKMVKSLFVTRRTL